MLSYICKDVALIVLSYVDTDINIDFDFPFFDEYILSDDGALATKRYVPLIKMSLEFYRPSDVTYLYGDATRARKELGWRPKISFEELVVGMVKSDLATVGISI